MRIHAPTFALVLVGAAAYAGCGLGDVGQPSLPEATTPGSPPVEVKETPAVDCVEPACQSFPLPPSAHAVRLTAMQWERTVRDLLKLPTVPGSSVEFPPDAVASADRFGSEAGDLIVTTQHWAAYQKAAEQLSSLVVDDDNALSLLLPDAAKDVSVETATRVHAFVVDFLPRAYRRAVTADEIASVVAAAEAAAAGVTLGDPFAVRVKWVLTTVLQSPKFVYRISFGEGAVVDGRATLSGYEIASKLSYGLWGTMPDDALMALARDGKLTKAGVADVARSMLKDPRAETALAEFHDELYLIDHFGEVKSRPAELFPRFYPEFDADAQEDMRRTVRDLVIEHDGNLNDLDTSTTAYVNTRLAPVYDVDPSTVPELAAAGSPDVFAKIQMDGTKRKGLLMHPGWLTYEASPKDPSPIRRGAYVARHVLCTPLGSPPPGAAGADPNKAPGATNRERVEATTKGCGDGCHGGSGGVINPLGFSFEGFDSIGTVRSVDNGVPVNTKGDTKVIGAFSGAVPLFDLVSKNARAHACYAAHWSAYLNGTSLVDVTPRYLSPAVAKSLKNASVREIIVELVQTDAFLTVSR
jgi:Protein of unknown function (DUF1592)/Protein of unknown function (DUF1588)/Protein of unknown function (DUF1595)/Protein of unknown function (DUF1587)